MMTMLFKNREVVVWLSKLRLEQPTMSVTEGRLFKGILCVAIVLRAKEKPLHLWRLLGEQHRHYGRLRRMLRGVSFECAIISVEQTILEQWGLCSEGKARFNLRRTVESNTRLFECGAFLR